MNNENSWPESDACEKWWEDNRQQLKRWVSAYRTQQQEDAKYWNNAHSKVCDEADMLRQALEAAQGLIRRAQERLCEYLKPDSNNDDLEAMNDLLYMFDGPEQREVEKKINSALKKYGQATSTKRV